MNMRIIPRFNFLICLKNTASGVQTPLQRMIFPQIYQSLSLDIYPTEWDDFIITDAKGKGISPVTGDNAHKADIDPTHQIRMGAEYLFTGSKYMTSLCGCLFSDPAPAKGSPDDFFGFSTGIGIGKFIFNIQ